MFTASDLLLIRKNAEKLKEYNRGETLRNKGNGMMNTGNNFSVLTGYAETGVYSYIGLLSLHSALVLMRGTGYSRELTLIKDDLPHPREAPDKIEVLSRDKVTTEIVFRVTYKRDGDEHSIDIGPMDLSIPHGEVKATSDLSHYVLSMAVLISEIKAYYVREIVQYDLEE